MNRDSSLSVLILDVGNSKTRLVGWRGGDQDPRQVGRGDGAVLPAAAPLLELGVVPTPATANDDYVVALSQLRAPYIDLPVILTAVVPTVVNTLRAKWSSLIVVDHRCRLPFRLALADPAAIGTDRLCNIAAAAASGCDRALVVDAGTATTFDLLLDGEFVGGLIAPGMALAAACLGENTAQLDPVPFAPCALAPGRDTTSALQAGAYHVGIGGVEAVIAGLNRKYGPMPVIVTGGLGGHLVGSDRLWDPDWTLRGAAVLADQR